MSDALAHPVPAASPVRILLLEDSDLDAELVVRQLRRSTVVAAITRTSQRAAFVAALEAERFDVILSDFSLPDIDGTHALALARELQPETPFIFVSGVLGEEFAIESMKEGATDYVLKQRLERLPPAVTRALNEARERRERRQAEERMALLVAELSHRVKNTLAMVVAMARLTLRQSDSLVGFEAAFFSRLQALSEAHSLIFQANWGATGMRQVVERALAPFRRSGEDGFLIEGDELRISPKFALSLTLMLHELGTNAVKHGALSWDTGRVRIAWRVDGASQMVRLNWREEGGPTVQVPQRKGFGHTLIERGVRYELNGDAKLNFLPQGLDAELMFPAHDTAGKEPALLRTR